MSKPKFRPSVISAILMAGFATALVIQFYFESRLREENDQLRRQVNQIAMLAAQNAHFSNSLVEARRSLAIGNKQLLELLRLRGETQGLRRQTNALHRELAQLRAGLPETDSETAESVADTGSLRTLARESWAFAGYATPEAAFQSVAWALSKGDVATFLASLTPEGLQFMQPQLEGKSEAEIAAMLTDEIGQTQVLRLDQKRDATGGKVTFVLSSKEREDGAAILKDQQLVTLKNIDGEWKLTAAPDE
jgi:hypothetical protein